jgi:type I restriction enzyme S subunit
MKPAKAPWIEEIPAHWEERPFFAVAKERRAKNIGMKEDNLLSLSYGNIVRKDINTPNGLLPESFETYQIVEPNDVVFRLTDLQNDKRSLRSAICPERGIITSAYLSVRSEGVLPGFIIT